MQDSPASASNSRRGILEFPCGIERLANGNTLIADAGAESGTGSELIEVDPAGEVVFQWSGGTRFLHGVKQLANGTIALADTTNDRLLEIDRSGAVLWSSDDWSGGTGMLSDGTHLEYPNNIAPAGDDRFLVTDRNNDRFVVVDRQGQVSRVFSEGIRHPHNCEPLPGGGAIIANSDGDSVDIVDAAGDRIWTYDQGLRWPRDANVLPSGNVLIADSKNSRVIEVTRQREIVWEYQADHFANIYEAHRLGSGNTLLSDQQHQQVMEVSPAGRIVWSFRNFGRETPVYDRLFNGSFRRRREDGVPEGWILARRLSEGGGEYTPGMDRCGRETPGMTYDRRGALCFRQTVAVKPGMRYTLGGELCTAGLSGFACLQVAFLDSYDGLLADAALCPRGEEFTDDTDWTQDSFEVVVPGKATKADVRVFMTGSGSVYFKSLRFFA